MPVSCCNACSRLLPPSPLARWLLQRHHSIAEPWRARTFNPTVRSAGDSRLEFLPTVLGSADLQPHSRGRCRT